MLEEKEFIFSVGDWRVAVCAFLPKKDKNENGEGNHQRTLPPTSPLNWQAVNHPFLKGRSSTPHFLLGAWIPVGGPWLSPSPLVYVTMDGNQYSRRRQSILLSFSASSSSFLLLFLLLHLLIIGPANSSLAAAELDPSSSSSAAASHSNFAEAHALDLSAERHGSRLSLSNPDAALSVSDSLKPNAVAVQPHLGLTFSSKVRHN